jgi:hypothetical protein
MLRRSWTRLTNRSVAGWLALSGAAALLVVVAWWNVLELRRTWDFVDAVLVTSTHGSMEIVSCDAGSESKGNWTCHGPFTSDDGSVRIDEISLRVPVGEGPGSIGSAAVSDDGAVQGWVPDWGMAVGRLGVHAIAGTVAYFACVILRAAWTSGKRSPRPAGPAIFFGPRPGTRKPRLPRNEHRNRRRRKKAQRR